VTNGVSISVSNSAFNNIGSGTVFGIPISVVILAVVALALIAFMRTTDIGRNIYAMGGNPIAARLAGIPVERYKLGIYGFAGLIAGLAGVILTARTTAGQPGSGTQDLALTSITAVLLGGTALAGGRGTIDIRDGSGRLDHRHPRRRIDPPEYLQFLPAGSAGNRPDLRGDHPGSTVAAVAMDAQQAEGLR
jgi:hypothetical protein